MKLSPRYGSEPILRIETSDFDLAEPVVRQRNRLSRVLARLDESQWAAATRCDGWSTQDVIAHLISTNHFWTISINGACTGEPTEYLANFDPVATPAQMVESVRSATPAETLAGFVTSNEALADAVRALDADTWTRLGEAPPGHIALRGVAMHALWDSWIHERDIVLPLGLDVVEEPDELRACLQYAAALGPAFLASTGSTRSGQLRVEAREPAIAFVVDAGSSVVVHDGPADEDAPVLSGPAVELIEALSYRVPLPTTFAADDRWLMEGLAAAFDTVA